MPSHRPGPLERIRSMVRPSVADVAVSVLGTDLPVAVRGFDGSAAGPADAPATLIVRSPDAISRVLSAPGELGLARAYVSGDLDVEGDLLAALDVRHHDIHLGPAAVAELLSLAGRYGFKRLPIPTEEARMRGWRHSKARDQAAIAHHYNVSNEFYRLLLGSTMAYSCAAWDDPLAFDDPAHGLEAAQEAKFDLVARKLDLRPGMRLLDVGCGWGGMVLHAAKRYGVDAVGVTISTEQAELAQRRVAEAGLDDHVSIRMQDFRDVHDGPFDAICSIGMYEHVGAEQLRNYVDDLFTLLRPRGRLLNHGITRPAGDHTRVDPRGFIGRYIFPDGELFEAGEVVSALQRGGFEVRHVESLREHYARTLRAWLANLEAGWDEAVELVGIRRARIWRLYIAGCAVAFEDGATSIHQVLAVKPDSHGASGLAGPPRW